VPFSKKEVYNFKAEVHVNGIFMMWAFSVPKNEFKKTYTKERNPSEMHSICA